MTPYSPFKGKQGLKRIFNATGYSVAGFKSAFRLEAAFRQIILLNIVLGIINFSLHLSALEHAILLIVGLLAIIVELFNSAIEAVVDRISLERHELSKNAKDMGSAAQCVALIMIATTWAIILFWT
ncbi:diacylglycerol kinase [Acinetobacter soli]|uniref:diacylglycerol kinase n=1 Tax=Acinetobacter soli TaxID=487316 RepID=UPI001C497555|nr:diacylglycerol kinase [Acinetobacter soli]MBV6550935.1 diacylglycerol kinase [Acinetobacter soli]